MELAPVRMYLDQRSYVENGRRSLSEADPLECILAAPVAESEWV
jgi:hypothetical protein